MTGEALVDVLSAAMTPLIAMIAIYIAYQQWKTNHLRLKHELFDRRFEIYKSVQKYLSGILREAKVNMELVPEILDAYQRSKFLLGDEIHDYIDEIYKRSINLRSKQHLIKAGNPENDREELEREEHAELCWLTSQLGVLGDKFDEHLSLVKPKSRIMSGLRRR